MTKPTFVVAIDLTGDAIRCLLFNRSGRVIASACDSQRRIQPQAGWTENDPAETWYKTKKVIAALLDINRTAPEEIEAIGITNDARTTIIWDPVTGEPYHNAILREDTRTEAICERMRAAGLEETIRAGTGLRISSQLAAVKIEWLLDNVDGLRHKAEQGRALFGTVDSWLIWNMTGRHVSDYTNAAGTMLWNLAAGRWDEELLERLSIPRVMLPEVLPSSEASGYGYTRPQWPFTACVAVRGVLAGPQAALLGEACFVRGDGLCTFGTGGSLQLCTGHEKPGSRGDIIATGGYAGRKSDYFALQVSIPTTDSREETRAVREALDLVQRDAGVRVSALKVNGAGARDDRVMQLQADALGIPVMRSAIDEPAALGAAYAAGLAIGYWKDLEEIRSAWKLERAFTPYSASPLQSH